MQAAYPFRLEPYVKEVVWGGRWLADELGRKGPPDAPLGESWEAYAKSVVTNGAWAGQTLGQLFEEHGAELMGYVATGYPIFPLLVKFIDAKQNLSVQVHPDNALAQKLEQQPFGKTEFWYIMAADPDASIYYSLNDKAQNKDLLLEALQSGNLPDYLQRATVRPGDVVFIPAGTVHALTAGIVVYELQQDSDITYRLYDWGRQGRQMHIEQGIQAINLNYRNLPITHPEPQPTGNYQSATLVSCPYFSAELQHITASADFATDAASFKLLSVLNGTGTLSSPDRAFETESLKKGDTVLVPAKTAYTLAAASDDRPLELIAGWLQNEG